MKFLHGVKKLEFYKYGCKANIYDQFNFYRQIV